MYYFWKRVLAFFVFVLAAGVVLAGCANNMAAEKDYNNTTHSTNADLAGQNDSFGGDGKKRLLKLKRQLTLSYSESIKNAVTRKFKPPTGFFPSAVCKVIITLEYPNKIIDVANNSCPKQMFPSARRAILGVNPFPSPPHRAVLRKQINFVFTLP